MADLHRLPFLGEVDDLCVPARTPLLPSSALAGGTRERNGRGHAAGFRDGGTAGRREEGLCEQEV